MKDNLSYDEDDNFDMNDQIENFSEKDNENNNDEEDDNNNIENLNPKEKDSLENQNKQTKQKRRSKNDFYGRDYVCGCGKTYLSYPALYTHFSHLFSPLSLMNHYLLLFGISSDSIIEFSLLFEKFSELFVAIFFGKFLWLFK